MCKPNLKSPAYYAWCCDKIRNGTAQCFITRMKEPLVVHHVRGRKMGDVANLVIINTMVHHWIHHYGYGHVYDSLDVSKEDFIAEAERLYAEYRRHIL